MWAAPDLNKGGSAVRYGAHQVLLKSMVRIFVKVRVGFVATLFECAY